MLSPSVAARAVAAGTLTKGLDWSRRPRRWAASHSSSHIFGVYTDPAAAGAQRYCPMEVQASDMASRSGCGAMWWVALCRGGCWISVEAREREEPRKIKLLAEGRRLPPGWNGRCTPTSANPPPGWLRVSALHIPHKQPSKRRRLVEGTQSLKVQILFAVSPDTGMSIKMRQDLTENSMAVLRCFPSRLRHDARDGLRRQRCWIGFG